MAPQGRKLDEQQVRERAYLIWEREGRPPGRDREHWAMAERELAERAGLPQSTKPHSIKKPAARKMAPSTAPSKVNDSSGAKAPRKRAASVAKPRAGKSSVGKTPRE